MRLKLSLIVVLTSLILTGVIALIINETKNNEIAVISEEYEEQLNELQEELQEVNALSEQLQEDYQNLLQDLDLINDQLSDIEQKYKQVKEDNKLLNKELQSKRPTPQPLVSRGSLGYRTLTVKATAYVSFCDTGCIGITARGTNVQDTIYHPNGLPIVAVDPTVIPLGSIVEIEGQRYIADDTGGDIKGNRIDILVATHDTKPAFEFGVQTLDIKVYNR